MIKLYSTFLGVSSKCDTEKKIGKEEIKVILRSTGTLIYF